MAAKSTTERPAFVVHAHFYQPPRENPWTEEVPREHSAAPFHDWNARVTAECYRPNTVARIIDEGGRVVDIVNNFERLSFDVGPTLMAWLERHAADVYDRILAADEACASAIAQAYGHLILPLANERDVRTQVRWGLADFEHRFGRPAEGMWLPECAVNDDVLRVLVEEGVRFTVLGPGQAAGPIDTRRAYRWRHPDGRRWLAVLFYDGPLSHDAAFGLGAMSSEALVDRVGREPGLVTLAADGETFGHHHHWGDRLLAYALDVEAPKQGIEVTNLARWVRRHAPTETVAVRERSWSCAHGVGRWRADCGCATGGGAGWNQRWRAPLRAALDELRDRTAEVFERRGESVLADPWPARDAYVGVLLGAVAVDRFAAAHVTGDRVEALTLLEAQRHAMSMYTSCGWFFNDLAGIETVQVLRYAARVMDLLGELGEDPGEEAFLETLGKAESNDRAQGTGRDVWARHVVPTRVDARRVAGHLALLDLLQGRAPRGPVGAYDVELAGHLRLDRGPVGLSAGGLTLSHLRTGRRHTLAWAALHLGGLEVVGAVRAVRPGRWSSQVKELVARFEQGRPVTDLLRALYEELGDWEFGLDAALPEAAEDLLASAARSLANRFAAAYEQLFEDHQATLSTLANAGYPLPRELRAPGELSLARRLEAEVAAQRGSLDPSDYVTAVAIAHQARAAGLTIDTPQARATVTRLLLQATRQAITDPHSPEGVDAAVAVLAVADELDLHVDVERAQELVHESLKGRTPSPGLRRLAAALKLRVD